MNVLMSLKDGYLGYFVLRTLSRYLILIGIDRIMVIYVSDFSSLLHSKM